MLGLLSGEKYFFNCLLMQIVIKSNKFEFTILKVTLNCSVMAIGVHSGLELTYDLNWDFLHVILHILCSGLDITQCLTWEKKKGSQAEEFASQAKKLCNNLEIRVIT